MDLLSNKEKFILLINLIKFILVYFIDQLFLILVYSYKMLKLSYLVINRRFDFLF